MAGIVVEMRLAELQRKARRRALRAELPGKEKCCCKCVPVVVFFNHSVLRIF